MLSRLKRWWAGDNLPQNSKELLLQATRSRFITPLGHVSLYQENEHQDVEIVLWRGDEKKPVKIARLRGPAIETFGGLWTYLYVKAYRAQRQSKWLRLMDWVRGLFARKTTLLRQAARGET